MTQPISFQKIATAIAFSPYAEANLHESARIAQMLNAELILIHVGRETEAKRRKLNTMVGQTVVNPDKVTIEFVDGDPVESILGVVDKHHVDLLIAGANKRENLIKFYTGSVARKLCRKANCSILLLTDRSVIRNKCKEVVVEGGDHKRTEQTVRIANYFGKVLDADHLTIIDEIDPRSAGNAADDDSQLEMTSKKRRELKQKEDLRIEQIQSKLKEEEALDMDHKCIFGKPGYTIGHYAAANRADLLVMRSPETPLGLFDRVFTHDLEYVLSDLPCCLMLVNQPTEDVA